MLSRAQIITSGICLIYSTIILLAWALPNFPLTLPPHSSMNPLVALLFFASGIAMVLPQKARRIFGVLIGSVAIVKIFAFIGYDLKIDETPFLDFLSVFSRAPNSMGVYATIAFIFVGTSFAFFDNRSGDGYPYSHKFILPAVLIGFMGSVSYLFSASDMTEVTGSQPIALSSSLLFLVVGIGILIHHGNKGILEVFLKKNPGSRAGRKLLFCVIGAPIFVGWLRGESERRGYVTPEHGVALMAMGWSIVGTAILWTRLHMTNQLEIEAFKENKREADSKLNRLKRFFPPSIAEMILSGQIEDPFKWRRTEITIIFIDIRGFTRFSEHGEPEEVMHLLQTYYLRISKVAQKHNGTVGHLAGDGVMIFFNAPISVENPQLKAVQMALDLRAELEDVWTELRYKEFELDFGAGIASGYTMVGGIGAEGFWDYTVIGNATNVAARLCSVAKHGQILISHRFLSSVETGLEVESVGAFTLKGIRMPVKTFNVVSQKDLV